MALYGRMTKETKLESALLEIASLRAKLDEMELRVFDLAKEAEGEEAKFMQAMETLVAPQEPGSPPEE